MLFDQEDLNLLITVVQYTVRKNLHVQILV